MIFPIVPSHKFVIYKFISDLKNAGFINYYVNMEIHNTNSREGNYIHRSPSFVGTGVIKKGLYITTE